MATNEELKIKISAEDNASATIKKAGQSFSDFGVKAITINQAFGAISASMGVLKQGFDNLVVEPIKAFMDAEQEMAIASGTLGNALDNLSAGALANLDKQIGGTDRWTALVNAMNSAGQAAIQLGFDDEAASQGFSKLFQASGNLTQAQSDLQLAMDMSARTGRDLGESVRAIQMVYAGGTKLMKEFGVEVKEGTKASEVLAIAQAKVGTAAKDAANTTKGQVMVMTQQWQNVKEEVGKALVYAFTPLLNRLVGVANASGQASGQSNRLAIALSYVAETAVQAFNVVGVAADALLSILGGLAQFFSLGLSPAINEFANAQYSALQSVSGNLMSTNTEFNNLRQSIQSGSLDATKFGGTGVNAMDNFAGAMGGASDKASDLKKELEDVNKKIADINKSFSDLYRESNKTEMDLGQQTAEAYVAQEQKVKDLKAQIASETDATNRSKLQTELQVQQDALNTKLMIEDVYHNEVADLRRRALLTDFERTIEDINNKRTAYSVQFGEKMAGLQAELKAEEDKRKKLLGIETGTTEIVKSAIAERVSAFKSGVNESIADAQRLASATARAYSQMSSISSGGMSYANMSHYQSGGIVNAPLGSPIVAMVHGGERVIPASRSDAGMTGGIVVNINGGTYLSEDVALEMGNMIADRLKLQLRI